MAPAPRPCSSLCPVEGYPRQPNCHLQQAQAAPTAGSTFRANSPASCVPATFAARLRSSAPREIPHPDSPAWHPESPTDCGVSAGAAGKRPCAATGSRGRPGNCLGPLRPVDPDAWPRPGGSSRGSSGALPAASPRRPATRAAVAPATPAACRQPHPERATPSPSARRM